MNIQDDAEDEPREKEIKVELPGELVVKLHSEKVLTGRYIKDIVADALTAYYEGE